MQDLQEAQDLKGVQDPQEARDLPAATVQGELRAKEVRRATRVLQVPRVLPETKGREDLRVATAKTAKTAETAETVWTARRLRCQRFQRFLRLSRLARLSFHA